VSGSGISWAICKSAPHSRQTRRHPTIQFFTGRTPFLLPNQQRQSNEGCDGHSDVQNCRTCYLHWTWLTSCDYHRLTYLLICVTSMLCVVDVWLCSRCVTLFCLIAPRSTMRLHTPSQPRSTHCHLTPPLVQLNNMRHKTDKLLQYAVARGCIAAAP